MRLRSRALLPGALGASAFLAIAACSDTFAPSGSSSPSLAIQDAVHSDGNAHFYFLPPLVSAVGYGGTFDAGVSPRVEVCEWSAEGCGAVITRFSMTTGTGSETIRVDAIAQHYQVNWHTDECTSGSCALDPAKTYRIRVLVLDTELGHADVDVVSRGNELKNVETDEYIALLNGRTLPIKFRIEVGALFVASPSETETQTFTTTPAEDGSTVSLELPPKSLSEPTAITMKAVEKEMAPVATDERIVTETVYEFGPDGATFDTPLKVTIGYDPARLAPGTDETKLRLFWTEKLADGTLEWRQVAGSTVDLEKKTVTGEVTHFSYGTIGESTCDVTPTASDPIDLYARQSMVATATFCDDAGQPFEPSNVSWWTDDDAVVLPYFDGGTTWYLFGIAPGTATVTAVGITGIDTIFAQTTVTITEAPVASAQMTDEVWVTIGEEETIGALFFNAFGDSARVSSTDVTWSIGDPAVASISGTSPTGTDMYHSATIQGNTEGATLLRVTVGSFIDSAIVRVTPVASLTVSGKTSLDTLFVGGEIQLTASVKDTQGNELTNRPVTWVSDDPTIASIDSTGRLRGIASGWVHIWAFVEGQFWSEWVQVF